MVTKSKIRYCIVIGLVLLVLICYVLPVNAADPTGTLVENTVVPDQNNSVVTNVTETITVPEVTQDVVDITSTQTIIPTVTSTINPTYSPVQTVISPVSTVSDDSKLPVKQKSLSPNVQRKISTNLLYVIDSNTPEIGLSRIEAQNTMQREGKLKAVAQTTSTGSKSARTDSSVTQTSNLVLVYIDLVPSASTSTVDSYLSSVTDRDEQDHSVIAWVNTNNLDSLASLDIVSNIRTAEPSVTKDSPVYYDTKFVNERAGLPPATVEEAKVSVREFEKTPGMVLEKKRTMTTSRGNVYDVASENSRYFVNAKTGVVEVAVFFDAQPSSNLQLILPSSKSSVKIQDTPKVTMDEAFTIAQDYARRNYKNFKNRTMILTESQLVDHGSAGKTYYFTWMEKINNIFTPNMVDISINYVSGDAISYIGIDQSLSVDLVPTISKDLAISKAIKVFSPIEVKKTESKLIVVPIDQNSQRLVWRITVTGVPKDIIYTGGDVEIDAHSGEIVQVDPVN
jgi:hypothetical protein